jgi:ribosomal protein L7Ae-like RNA K-turn-binding protein
VTRPAASGVLALLGLGYRARNVVIGVDAVRTELKAGKLRCVVLAADAGPRAEEKVVRLAVARGIPIVPGPLADEIGAQLGKPPVQAVGIRDRALAEGIRSAAARSAAED